MKVLYKCSCCADEREVLVPDRVDNTDVSSWMDVVQYCVSYDHSARSSRCKKSTMDYVKIAVEKDLGLGVARKLS